MAAHWSRVLIPIINLQAHLIEHLLYIIWSLCWCLDERNPKVISECLPFVSSHRPFILEVNLIPDEEFAHLRIREFVNFSEPFPSVLEALSICDVVNDCNSVRAVIIVRRDALESFLAGCVPNLKLDLVAIDVDVANLEINADSWNIIIAECLIRELDEKRAFADCGVANNE